MNTELIRRQMRHAHLAAFALMGIMTGCGDPASGTFDAAASQKIAAEKGLKPGGPTKERGKLLKQGRETTNSADTSLRKQ
jgi:hypothetical protein